MCMRMVVFVWTFYRTGTQILSIPTPYPHPLLISPFRWSPTYDVAAILTSIQSLLPDPNTASPANAQAAQMYVENRAEYNRRVCINL